MTKFIKIMLLTKLVFFTYVGKIIAKENLVTDLSENTVEISSTFSGAKILLFGAYDGQKDDDIIVIVSGPRGNVKIDKKEKKFGIWVTSENFTFSNVPKYYYIASNKKISQITNENEIISNGLNFKNLEIKSFNFDNMRNSSWYEALIRNMKKKEFWKIDENSIELNKNTLFRKTLTLPSNVTTGIYDVKILHYRSGNLISQEISKIKVGKTGISANIYNVAQNYSAIYGIVAVMIALFVGWFTNLVLRKI